MNNFEDQLGQELQLVAKSQPSSEMPSRLLKLRDSGLLDCRSHLEPAGATLVWSGKECLSLGEASAGMGNDSERTLIQLIEIREVAFRTGYEDGEPTIWYISMKGIRDHNDMQPDAARSKADLPAPGDLGRLAECLNRAELAAVREALQNSNHRAEDFRTEELCALSGGLRNGYMIMPESYLEPILDFYFDRREQRNCLSVVLFPKPGGPWHLAVFTPGDTENSEIWDTARAFGLQTVTTGETTGSLMAEVDPSEAIRVAEVFAKSWQQQGAFVVQ